ncbi:MAG: hypothetical protein AAF628_17915 [Planctomycetota bacterium]
MRTWSVPIALVLCVAPLMAQQPDGGGRVLRHLPIREWVAASRSSMSSHTTLPLGSMIQERHFGRFWESGDMTGFLLTPPREASRLSADVMVDLLDPLLEELGEVLVSAEGSSLVLIGPPEGVRKVETQVRELVAGMVRAVRIRASLFELTDDRALPAVAEANQIGTLTRGLPELWSGTTVGYSGAVMSLGRSRTTSLVLDVDVEVSEKAGIGDPDVAGLFDGVSLAVEPHVLAGSSDLVVFCQFACAEQPQPVMTRATGVRDMPSLDVPVVDAISGSMSGRVRNQGALLLSARGEGSGGRSVLLVVRAEAAPVTTKSDTVWVAPVSGLLSKALREQVVNEPMEWQNCPLRLDGEEDSSQWLGPRDRDDLEEMLREALSPDDDADLVMIGNSAILRAEANTRVAAERVLVGLQDELLRTVAVTARTIAEETATGEAKDPAGGAVHAVTFPALLARPHVLVRGRETTAVTGIDVEIAKNSTMSNPMVDRVFSGLFLSCYAYPGLSGLGVEATIDVIHTAPPRRRPRESEAGGDLYLPRTARARLRHAGAVPAETEPMHLGDGPVLELADRAVRTSQTLRVQRLD